MWRIYNIVQLQPRFLRNLGSNSSSHSPPPLIIDSSKSSTSRNHGTPKSQQKNSNENLADRVSEPHSSFNGDSKKLVSRFKEFLRNRFYNCNESSTESGHFSGVQEMADNSPESSAITKDNMSTYTNASLKPVKKFELDSNFSQESDIPKSGCDSYGTTSSKEQICKETHKLNVPQFLNKNSNEIWRGQPPSKKLEEILKSLREWENKIGWFAPNPVCGIKSSHRGVSKKQDLDKIARYALEMQKKNNIRNQRRHLAVGMKSGLRDHQKKASTITEFQYTSQKLSGDELMKIIKSDQLMKTSKLTKEAFSNPHQLKSVEKSSYLNEFTVPSSKSEHDERLKVMELNKKITKKFNESWHKKINKFRTITEEKQDHNSNQKSDIECISTEVKEIDSIIRHCKNLQQIYTKRLKYKCSFKKLHEKCKRKNHRDVQYTLMKRGMDENKNLKTTTKKVCVDKKPKFRISVVKLKTLNECKTASVEILQNEVKRMLVKLKKRSELKKIKSDDFEKSRKHLSLSEIKYAISESKNTFKELSMNSKTRNFGTKVSIKEDEFLKKCQIERNRKKIQVQNCEQADNKGNISNNENKYKEATKSVSKLKENCKEKGLEANDNEFMRNDSKDSNIYRTDDGISRYISTASPSSVLYKIFESDALMQIFKDSFETRRSCSELYLPNRGTLSEPEKADSEAQFNLNRDNKNKLWIVQWMRAFAQTPLHLRTNSNILFHLPHFKGGYFIGNTQLSIKLLDLKEDQMYGYDESES